MKSRFEDSSDSNEKASVSMNLFDGTGVMDPAISDSGKNVSEIDRLSAQTDPNGAMTESMIIEQSILRKMQLSPYQEMRSISVSSEVGIVTLRGTLSSFFLKQLAQEIAKSVPDVDSVFNEIDVAIAR